VSDYDFDTDLLIVGTGATGLVAALAAAEQGLRPLVVEKSDLVGGSSSLSGGGLWIPANPLQRAAGVPDSIEDARRYLDALIGDVGPASSAERRDAFVRTGPELVDFLRGLGFRFVRTTGYPDYHPDEPGASVAGRCVEAKVFNGRTLGPWLAKLLIRPGATAVPFYSREMAGLGLARRTVRGFGTAVRVRWIRRYGRAALRQTPLTGGASLVGQLLRLALARSVDVWLASPLVELIERDGRVAGAIVERDGRPVRVGAARGVLLAAGGFARDGEMREKYQRHPITGTWTMAASTDSGDAIRAGMAVGAATALMDDAWWGPAVVLPNGYAAFVLRERSLPGSIIVDRDGQRFMNESASYVVCGHRMYERDQTVPAIPAWLILDGRHRQRYPFVMLRPGHTPDAMVDSGFLRRSATLADLAEQIGVDAGGLTRTVERFNRFAAAGRDDDFDRGGNAYDRYYGDPRVRPNPNLGPIDTPPYYAAAVYPGDLGTKGGLLTDGYARVLRADGSTIAGLYAAGNTTASVMGRTYPGPGCTLAAATVFAYRGARHAAGTS
jgi:3-oxosteroid 1-dehydrogenase